MKRKKTDASYAESLRQQFEADARAKTALAALQANHARGAALRARVIARARRVATAYVRVCEAYFAAVEAARASARETKKEALKRLLASARALLRDTNRANALLGRLDGRCPPSVDVGHYSGAVTPLGVVSLPDTVYGAFNAIVGPCHDRMIKYGEEAQRIMFAALEDKIERMP